MSQLSQNKQDERPDAIHVATLEDGWVGIDLDGVLSITPAPDGIYSIGAPVPGMVQFVRQLLDSGVKVRIFTARVGACGETSDGGLVDDDAFAARQTALIEAWCEEHLGQILPVTATKDFRMVSLYDDRAYRVVMNTGIRLATEPQLGSLLGWLDAIRQIAAQDIPPSERLESIRHCADRAIAEVEVTT